MNLPNKITIARIIMILIFLVVCNVDDQLPTHLQKSWRAAGFIFSIIAGLTDILDGYIARKYNMVSDFGKLMDPLADKIFIVTAFIMMVDKNLLPGWIAVIILSREFMVTGLRLLAANKGIVISADVTGKIKTSLQMSFLIMGGSIWVGWLQMESLGLIWPISMGIVVIFTVYSGVSYFIQHRDLYMDSLVTTNSP